MGFKITKVASYLPEVVVTNDDLARDFGEISAEKIESKLGIKERRITKEGETSFDMAFEACKKVLDGEDKGSIDFVMLCTQSPDYFLPTTACVLQHKLGLGTHVGAFDFNLGCSGYVYGLALAKGLLESGVAKKILLVTSETYSKFINEKDKGNRTIFGDGASASIIESSNNDKYQKFAIGTDGEGAENLIVPRGGMRCAIDNSLPLKEIQKGSFRTDNDLFMNGPEIFNFTIKAVPELVRQACEKNEITIDDLDYVIFHQANKYMLNHLRKKLKLPKEKFYMNMENTGNTVSSTIPIALEDALKNEYVFEGSKVLLVGFGVGYSYAAVVLEL